MPRTRETLRLRNVGPIKDANIEFGGLTVLVGPQASGKSIFLQYLKLLLDSGPIFRTLHQNGIDWEADPSVLLDVFFGEGMAQSWRTESEVVWRGHPVSLWDLANSKRSAVLEESFFIPAQRVLALSQDGWLRRFTDYRAGDPFVVRDFSEKLRILMDTGFLRKEAVYPAPHLLKPEIRDLLQQNVFPGLDLRIEKKGAQKRLVLSKHKQNTLARMVLGDLPFMVWSAGQREFVPLLLGLYWLMPPSRVKRRGHVRWVMIEELEMGLHPRGIETVLLIVLELMWRGYRVCLSTHSPTVLDLVWALRNLQEHDADPRQVLRLFGFSKPSSAMLKLGASALSSISKIYYFDNKTGITQDISTLDPGSHELLESDWGGLTEFSRRAEDVVADVVARRSRRA